MQAMVLKKACIQRTVRGAVPGGVRAEQRRAPPRVTALIPDAQKIGVQEAADSCPVAAIQVTA